MANTLDNLIPEFSAALDVVSREMVGMIPAVTRDPSADRAAVGQTVRSPVAPAAAATDITPGVTPPDDGDQTIGQVPITITKARRVPFRWNGEQTLGLNNGRVSARQIQAHQIQQAIRTLTNEIEADLCALDLKASRAYGNAAVPFAGGDLTDLNQVRKILVDNGAPTMGLQCVMDTSAGANLRSKTQLSKVNESGDTTLLRQGVISETSGMFLRESGQIVSRTKGTGASATTTGAGFAVGITSIPLASVGTGTIVAGDVISFAGDSEKYVVVTGDTDVSDGGTIVIAEPGLRQAIPAATTAITVVNAHARSMVFAQSAILLATRMPALPDDGDMALDRATIIDPRSGMVFELALYAQYRQMQYEVSACWGANALKTEHIALLLEQS
jgi:hypothetical protein